MCRFVGRLLQTTLSLNEQRTSTVETGAVCGGRFLRAAATAIAFGVVKTPG